MPRPRLPRIAHPARTCTALALLAVTTACAPATPTPTYPADTSPVITYAPDPTHTHTHTRPTSPPTSASRPTSWPITVCGTADGPLVRLPDEVCDIAGAQERNGRHGGCPVSSPSGRVQWWTASPLGFDGDDGTEVGEPLDDDYLGEIGPIDDTNSFTPPPVPPHCAPLGDAP